MWKGHLQDVDQIHMDLLSCMWRVSHSTCPEDWMFAKPSTNSLARRVLVTAEGKTGSGQSVRWVERGWEEL